MIYLLADQLYPGISGATIIVDHDFLRSGYSAVKIDFTIAAAKSYGQKTRSKVVIDRALKFDRSKLLFPGDVNPSFPVRIPLRISERGNVRFASFYRDWQIAMLGSAFLRSTDAENRRSANEFVSLYPLKVNKQPMKFGPKTHLAIANGGRAFALARLREFIDNDLSDGTFGLYQDVVVFDDDGDHIVNPHSCLSAALNCGLILQGEIIDRLIERFGMRGLQAPAVEAFIRQLAWRNYMWEIWLSRDRLKTAEPKKQNKKIWSIDYPIQAKIAMECATKTGYLNHIGRLMVVGAWMMMNHVDPRDAYAWFLNNFIDSYDWVMYGNVYGMLYGIIGVMTRIYPCNSHYISRMVSVKGDEKKWDDAYAKFKR